MLPIESSWRTESSCLWDFPPSVILWRWELQSLHVEIRVSPELWKEMTHPYLLEHDWSTPVTYTQGHIIWLAGLPVVWPETMGYIKPENRIWIVKWEGHWWKTPRNHLIQPSHHTGRNPDLEKERATWSSSGNGFHLIYQLLPVGWLWVLCWENFWSHIWFQWEGMHS